MSESRYKVPDQQVNRVWSAVKHLAVNHQNVKDILEAFAADLSENPVVPSEDHWRLFQRDVRNDLCPDGAMAFAEWFQRIMFRQPEEEVPEELMALLCKGATLDRKERKAVILAAYRIGKRSK